MALASLRRWLAPSRPAPRPTFRPRVEGLEDRAVPASVAPPAGIIGWWPGDGGPNDISGSTYAVPLNDTSYAAGQVGQAFSFDGSDDGLAVGGSANVQGARTIEAWVFPHANSGYGLPILTGGTVGHGDFFGVAGTTGTNSGTAQYDLYVDHWNTPTYHSTATLTPEAWNHVALTYDGSNLTFYINGKAAGSVTGSLYDYAVNTYTIGGNEIGGTTTKASMNGLIDEPTLYGRALSAPEIQSIYNAGPDGKTKPFAVVGNTPGIGQTVPAPPTDFVIKLTQAYDPASVSAAALTVNGVPADSVTLTDAQTLTFHYATSPVTAQGGQTMQLAGGALTAAATGAPVAAFSGSFLYEYRLNPPPGSLLDPTFGSGGQVISSFTNDYDEADAVTVQPDGKLVIAGTTLASGSSTGYDFLVARYNADGTRDASFGSGGYTATDFNKGVDKAAAVALQPQASGPARIVAVGSAMSGRNTDVGLARYNANGTRDATFGNKGKTITNLNGITAQAVVVDGSGRILVAAGTFLLRYTANGALDATFGNNGEVATGVDVGGPGQHRTQCIALQSDGKIVVGSSTGSSGFVLTRITARGAIDTTFGSGGTVTTLPTPTSSDNFRGLTLQGDGKIVVAGDEANADPDGVYREGEYLLRYNPDGSLDSTFGSGGITYLVNPAGLYELAEGGGVAVQSDGAIVAGGMWAPLSGAQTWYFGVVRASASGALDTGYGTGGWATTTFGPQTVPNALALEPDGRVVLAGRCRPGWGATDVALARFLPGGPQVGSLTANGSSGSATVASGGTVTLAASAISDANPGATVTQVTFSYQDGTGNVVTLGTGTQTSPGVWTYGFAVSLSPGLYIVYAQATDSDGAIGDPIALTLQVQ
jgi:uncharacterized delta-60 repeat protein